MCSDLPDLGWTPLIEGNFEVVPASGTHASMLKNPNAKMLAVRMQDYLHNIYRGLFSNTIYAGESTETPELEYE